MQRTHSAGTLAVQSSANFEESEAYFTPMAGEEVANRGAGSLLSGQRGNSGEVTVERHYKAAKFSARVLPFWLLWHRGGLNVSPGGRSQRVGFTLSPQPGLPTPLLVATLIRSNILEHQIIPL